jgi:hypothetical protein
MFEKFKGHPVGHIIEPSLDEERFATRAMLARIKARYVGPQRRGP